MLNPLKHLNNYRHFFKNANVYSIKSFRKQSHILFMNLLMRSYKLHLNNLAVSLVSIFSRMSVKVLLSILTANPFNSLSAKLVFENFITTAFGGYLFSDVHSARNGIVLTCQDVSNWSSFYSLLTNVHIIRVIICSFTVFTLSRVSSLPTKRKLFTILRSPHTDKKSREQFVMSHLRKVFFDNLGFTNVLLQTSLSFYWSSFQLKSSTFQYRY